MLRWTCCLCTVGQVVSTLPEGEPVVGVTSLDDMIFVLRWKERDQVEVYDVKIYRLQRCLTVPDARGFTDMTSCEHYRCVYIGDHNDKCIHRLDVQGAATRWAVNDKPSGLSVNAAHNVLVTCREARKIKEFSSHGYIARELPLSVDLINPLHAIQLTSGEFVVCHGEPYDAVHRVCKISEDGREIINSHGGRRGSDIGQCNVPLGVAVDSSEFVYVVDNDNRRVTLLSPTLDYVREVVSPDRLNWEPRTVYVQGRRLYVTDNDWRNGVWTTGRVVVISV